MSSKSQAEDLLAMHLDELGLYYQRQYRFHAERKWTIDFYVMDAGLGIEVEGAIWTRGRHTRGMGYQNDLTKYNHATMAGIRLLRFSTRDVETGAAKEFIRGFLEG